MGMYYLDLETTGFNPEKDKILTIQYQRLDDRNKGKPLGELIILKEWESSEEEIVKKFFEIFITDNQWEFIPVMQNHLFDFKFLFSKFKKYCNWSPNYIDFMFSKPFIDIKYTLVMSNNLSFKNAGLDKFTDKLEDGRKIPEWYENQQYNRIEEYVQQEAKSFIGYFEGMVIYLGKRKV